MRYLRALVLLASLLLPGASAVASVLTIADCQGFHDPDLKMLSIGDDLYALITNQPVTHSPDCLIELASKFDAVHADLHTVGTLVGVAADMADNADELRVIHYLDLAAWGFIEKLKYHRLILNSVVSKCTEADVVSKEPRNHAHLERRRYLSPAARQKDRRKPVREGRTGRIPGQGLKRGGLPGEAQNN
jgi:hypothetical protein